MPVIQFLVFISLIISGCGPDSKRKEFAGNKELSGNNENLLVSACSESVCGEGKYCQTFVQQNSNYKKGTFVFKLKYSAQQDTVEVYIDGNLADQEDWDYFQDQNAISIQTTSFLAEQGSTIKVTYDTTSCVGSKTPLPPPQQCNKNCPPNKLLDLRTCTCKTPCCTGSECNQYCKPARHVPGSNATLPLVDKFNCWAGFSTEFTNNLVWHPCSCGNKTCPRGTTMDSTNCACICANPGQCNLSCSPGKIWNTAYQRCQ